MVSSQGTDYILYEHEDFSHYGPYEIPSKISSFVFLTSKSEKFDSCYMYSNLKLDSKGQ